MSLTVMVVGASLAGMHAARTLRREGFEGTIVVVDRDPNTPYDRPPLSKQFLTGEIDEDRFVLAAVREELELDLRLGVTSTRLELDPLRVGLAAADGSVSTMGVDGVVIATGAAARRLPDTEGVAGVHVLRTLDDARRLRADLGTGPGRVVVIGAGFIGAEVASSCRSLGLAVTVVEAAPQPLERILGAEMGGVCAALHREHGTDLRLGVPVAGLRVEADERGQRRVTGVEMADDEVIDADVVVVGIGVEVATGWLEGSGLELGDGIRTDETLRAAPGVVVAGDIANYPSGRFGTRMRVEHWEHAIAGGEAAARRLLAEQRGETAAAFDPVPWFWSDQYGRKIQLAGRPAPGDELRVVHGSVEEFRFVALYGREGMLTGVLGMSRPRHVVQLGALIEQGASFDEALERAASV